MKFSNFIPGRDAIKSLLSLTEYNYEPAKYLYKQVFLIMSHLKNSSEYMPFVTALKDVFLIDVKAVDPQHSAANSFAGQRVLPPQMAAVEAEKVTMPEVNITARAGMKSLTLEIISQANGMVDRVYKLPSDMINTCQAALNQSYAYLDFLFKKWMGLSGIERKDGIMYDVINPENKVPLSPEQVEERVSDPKKGFPLFVNNESGGSYQISAVTVVEPLTKASGPAPAVSEVTTRQPTTAPEVTIPEQEQPTSRGGMGAGGGGG